MDWNTRARELLQLGLGVKQIAKLRDTDAFIGESFERAVDLNHFGMVVARRGLDPKTDIFFAPFEWIRDTRWATQPGDNVDWSRTSAAPSFPTFDSFHSECELLRRLRHDDVDWNVRVLKFHWSRSGAIVIPTRPIAKDEEIVRDWCNGPSHSLGTERRCAMLVALKVQFRNQQQREYHEEIVHRLQQEMNSLQGLDIKFSTSSSSSTRNKTNHDLSSTKKCHIFTDDPTIERYLKQGTNIFIFDENKASAEYWYSLNQFKFGQIALPHHLKGINQFPYEAALVRKDICLVQVLRACLANVPSSKAWILPAFDMATELAQFLKAFEGEAKKTWVVKPAQRARSAGIVISNDLEVLLGAMNAFQSEDKVAQVYVDRPLLLRNRRKFDLRTIVVVEQLGFGTDLVAWINQRLTYARIAREDFDLNDLTKKSSHLTVSRYDSTKSGDGDDEADVNDFPTTCSRDRLVSEFLNETEGTWWLDSIEPRARVMMRQVMEAASHWITLKVQNQFPMCRGACYGIDWIVDDKGFPKLIEVNFGPDLMVASEICRRAITPVEETILKVLTGLYKDDTDLGSDWIRL